MGAGGTWVLLAPFPLQFVAKKRSDHGVDGYLHRWRTRGGIVGISPAGRGASRAPESFSSTKVRQPVDPIPGAETVPTLKGDVGNGDLDTSSGLAAGCPIPRMFSRA